VRPTPTLPVSNYSFRVLRQPRPTLLASARFEWPALPRARSWGLRGPRGSAYRGVHGRTDARAHFSSGQVVAVVSSQPRRRLLLVSGRHRRSARALGSGSRPRLH